MNKKINLIVAAAQNMGIGYKGGIPWVLRKDLALFAMLTKTTVSETMRNAVVMGRRTWESIPEKNRPLNNRLNIVLSRSANIVSEGVLTFQSLDQALKHIHTSPLMEQIDEIWVIGGASVYKEAIQHPDCHRVYMTRVLKDFECDVFCDPIDETKFKLVQDPRVPEDIQEENGLQFQVEVYQKLL